MREILAKIGWLSLYVYLVGVLCQSASSNQTVTLWSYKYTGCPDDFVFTWFSVSLNLPEKICTLSDMFTLDSWYSSSQLSLFSPWLLQSAYLLNQLHHQRDSISLGSGSGDTHINYLKITHFYKDSLEIFLNIFFYSLYFC